MRSYLSLIPISAKVNKRQNRMTLLCIAISVFLVTAVFGMAEMGFRMEADRLSAKHENFSLATLLNSTMGQTLVIISLVLFVLILVAGVLMISGSINSNVAQRTQFFGMMRCIGMSRRQISYFVRLEALNWCRTAIPMGLVSGIFITWIACALLRYVVGTEFSEIRVFFVSIPSVIGGIAVGMITVLLAASKPAKKAASVSPVSAISGNTAKTRKKAHRIGNSIFRIETRLGIHHATGMRKNLFLMAGSFALSIILFFSFLVMTDLVTLLVPQSRSNPDIMIASEAKDNDLPESLKEELSAGSGILHVYGRKSLIEMDATVELGDFETDKVDMISFDDYELMNLAKDHSLQWGSSISKVYGDSQYVLATWDPESPLKIGDRIRIGSETVEIAGLLKKDPFYDDGLTHGKITLIPSTETLVRLTGVRGYRMILIQLSPDATDSDVEEIYQTADHIGFITDNHEYSTKGTYIAFMVFVYGFLAIIALVSLLNIINSISMSVSARIKQYGAMRAVGMSVKQVTKMITVEALTYAISGCILGCAIGLTINRLMYQSLIENHFAFATWSIPIIPLLIALVFVLGAALLAVLSPAARILNMAITETINEL